MYTSIHILLINTSIQKNLFSKNIRERKKKQYIYINHGRTKI